MRFLSPDQTLPDTYTIVQDTVALKKIFVELMAITLMSPTALGFVLSALQAFPHLIVKVI